MAKINLKIKGMHCQSCEKIISEELEALPGVSNIQISSVEGVGSVEIEEGKVAEQEIIEAIKRAGYEAEITQNDQSGFFDVQVTKKSKVARAANHNKVRS